MDPCQIPQGLVRQQAQLVQVAQEGAFFSILYFLNFFFTKIILETRILRKWVPGVF
jgi:hypothetical protein